MYEKWSNKKSEKKKRLNSWGKRVKIKEEKKILQKGIANESQDAEYIYIWYTHSIEMCERNGEWKKK